MRSLSLKSVLPIAFASILACLAPLAMQAQSDKAHGILDQGVKVTGLTGADAAPWHIKANYTFYDPMKGTETESGTFEEWWSSPWTWHRVYTEKKLSGEEWSTSHLKQFKRKDNKLDVVALDQKVANPLTNPLLLAANYKPDVEMTGVAGLVEGEALNCVSATSPAAHANGLNPDLLFPRFCLDIKDSTLRYTTTSTTMTAYSDFKPMGSRQVATKVAVKPYNKLAAALEITQLEALPAGSDAQLAPAPKTIPQAWPHQPGDPALVPVKITECAYTMDARTKQEVGMVYIPIVIQKNGSVKVNGYPSGPPDLASSASDCVSNWKFQPFMLDGEAVVVSDTALYDFDGKPFKGSVVLVSQAPAPAAK